ncbi:unnamed protein product [Linum trigynum]|uniref:Uncharacterized protein n=1 Tax=Linum trigynum TaxID=586398 RepID=A0AAV2DNT9_9ROSI
MRIGERIGKPLRVDHATSSGARSDYARVCVQVDITKPLLSQFTIHGKTYFVQYEGLEKICLKCGTYFERARCYCTVPTEEMETEETSKTPQVEVPKEPEPLYGEWMIAKKKPRTRKPNAEATKGSQERRTDKGQGPRSRGGSRFDVLEVEETEGNEAGLSQVAQTTKVSARSKNKEGGKDNGKNKETMPQYQNASPMPKDTRMDSATVNRPEASCRSQGSPSSIPATASPAGATPMLGQDGYDKSMEVGGLVREMQHDDRGGEPQEEPPDPRNPPSPPEQQQNVGKGNSLGSPNENEGGGLSDEAPPL